MGVTGSALTEVALYDTTPGGGGVFAPPADWSGSGDDYRALLRERWQSPDIKGWLQTAAAHTSSNFVVFVGPYADPAAAAVAGMARKFRREPGAVGVLGSPAEEGANARGE